MMMQSVQCMLVGDVVGKTCLTISYTTNSYPDKVPDMTIGIAYSLAKLTVDGKPVTLQLWDFSSNERFSSLRAAHYSRMDVVLICFSLTSRYTFENCHKFHQEVRQTCKEVPVILVGTMLDRRDKEDTKEGNQYITCDEGEALAEEIGAVKYLECSALTLQGVKTVFDEAIRAALRKEVHPPKPEEKKCNLL